jgi:transcriptional regulator EpsA
LLKKLFDDSNETRAISSDNAPAMLSASVINPASGKTHSHATFLEVISSSLAINTSDELVAWMQDDLQHIFPHGMMVCAIGEIEHFGSHVHLLLTHNFPLEYIQSLKQAGGLTSSPIIAEWVKTRKPVLFELSEQHVNLTWLDNFKRYGLHNVAAHGLCDMQSRMTSYFSFSQIPGKLTTHHAALLEMLVPHLHVTLVRTMNGGVTKTAPPTKTTLPTLTPREQEVWQWLCLGKTNWEIAQVLHLSESTIKNHVQRILNKLNVNTRAQAVAIGLLPT